MIKTHSHEGSGSSLAFLSWHRSLLIFSLSSAELVSPWVGEILPQCAVSGETDLLGVPNFRAAGDSSSYYSISIRWQGRVKSHIFKVQKNSAAGVPPASEGNKHLMNAIPSQRPCNGKTTYQRLPCGLHTALLKQSSTATGNLTEIPVFASRVVHGRRELHWDAWQIFLHAALLSVSSQMGLQGGLCSKSGASEHQDLRGENRDKLKVSAPSDLVSSTLRALQKPALPYHQTLEFRWRKKREGNTPALSSQGVMGREVISH